MTILQRKNIIYSLVLFVLMGSIYLYRTNNSKPKRFFVSGITMGVIPYHVKYLDSQERAFDKEIDSILIRFNQALSIYISDSEISSFNKDSIFYFKSPFFYPVLQRSEEIYKITEGAFDPTVMPLVKGWGFGVQKEPILNDTTSLDSLLELVGFNNISFDKNRVIKNKKGIELDFGAIAKGYAVDIITIFLKEKGISNLFVEIGGEIVCFGKNQKGKNWLVGIEDPTVSGIKEQKIFQKIEIENRALATSGNYRNFYIKDGKKFAHTISPKTGKPVFHNLLSVSVFAADCMTADALATAFMVMGKDKAINIVENNPELDAYFIFDSNKKITTYHTKGLNKVLIQ